jgi:hypothetical protein
MQKQRSRSALHSYGIPQRIYQSSPGSCRHPAGFLLAIHAGRKTRRGELRIPAETEAYSPKKGITASQILDAMRYAAEAALRPKPIHWRKW